jgi:hypothetical protein
MMSSKEIGSVALMPWISVRSLTNRPVMTPLLLTCAVRCLWLPPHRFWSTRHLRRGIRVTLQALRLRMDFTGELLAALRMTRNGGIFFGARLGQPRAPVSPPAYLRYHWFCRRYGLDSEGESIDLAHDDSFSGGDRDRGDGVPQLAVHEYFSGRRQRGLRDSDFTD